MCITREEFEKLKEQFEASKKLRDDVIKELEQHIEKQREIISILSRR